MRISDWSSDVCSSDLRRPEGRLHGGAPSARGRHRLFRRRLHGDQRRPVLDHRARRVDRGRAVPRREPPRRGGRVTPSPEGPGPGDRQSVVQGKSVSVSVETGGRGIYKKKIREHNCTSIKKTQNKNKLGKVQ